MRTEGGRPMKFGVSVTKISCLGYILYGIVAEKHSAAPYLAFITFFDATPWRRKTGLFSTPKSGVE